MPLRVHGTFALPVRLLPRSRPSSWIDGDSRHYIRLGPVAGDMALCHAIHDGMRLCGPGARNIAVSFALSFPPPVVASYGFS